MEVSSPPMTLGLIATTKALIIRRCNLQHLAQEFVVV